MPRKEILSKNMAITEICTEKLTVQKIMKYAHSNSLKNVRVHNSLPTETWISHSCISLNEVLF